MKSQIVYSPSVLTSANESDDKQTTPQLIQNQLNSFDGNRKTSTIQAMRSTFQLIEL